MTNKVLHILPSLNIYGGTPKKILNYIMVSQLEHFVLHLDSNIEHTNSEQFKDIFKNVLSERFYNIPKHKLLYKNIFSIYKILKYNDIQVINCYFDFELTLCAILKLFYSKLIIVHSFVGSNIPNNKLKRLLIHLIYRKVDRFTAISNYVFTAKMNYYSFLAKKRISIIPNGASILGKKNYKSNNSTFIITYIAGLNKYKNHFLTPIIAKKLVKTGFTDFKFQIIGDGPLRGQLSDFIIKYNVEDKIDLMGYRSDIEELLISSDLYFHPADKEGFGIAVIEAMLLKVPVIVSNTGGLPEIVDDTCGVLVDPYNADLWVYHIINLYQDYQLRKNLGVSGYKKANKLFTNNIYRDNFDNFYSSI